MEKRFLSIEEFNQLLQQWNGESIKIVKHELDDLDETLLDLDSLSYSNNDNRGDGYEARHSLYLNGSGVIETTSHNYETLPKDFYEIPLEDSTLYEFDGSRFILSTTRGVYTIEIANNEHYM
ncbi:hypothetical protein [Oceanobacillus chungangensis]|uniref:Uncharacterized protein n=1 Tax=Oceanobacillus chungangensis TaxID=1229152 RepID=A0A3D8PK17_9BACI|nr:hypothetical protein [Oceanobacillus chungangensis]RDW15535.1 hypothetical protein CWR45_17315 [Oceanobacillus chungangensis]